MSEELDFKKQYKYEVEVSEDVLGSLGSGTLWFGAGSTPHITFNVFSNYGLLLENELHRALKAKTASGICITLFNCKRIEFRVGWDLLVAGDVGSSFKGFEIRYSDISEWFMPWQQLDGNVGETISWVNPTKHISANIRANNEEYSLTTKSETSIKRLGEDHVLHEHILFCFEHLSGSFPPEQIQTKSIELLRLLSILIAYPISITSITVICEKGIAHGAFFPTYKHVERDDADTNFSHKCFIRQQVIYDRWETILNQYFNSSYHEVTWTRLAGMQRYEGFWEYRALGYVALLDKYVDQRYRESKGKKKVFVQVDKRKATQFDCEMEFVEPPLQSTQRDQIKTILNKIFSYKPNLDFGEKYLREISASDKDTIKIVNISDADFKIIKTVRNKIAHGEAFDLPESDLGRVGIIVDKIVLLMTYWAFLDFGLTNEDFLLSLRSTHNNLRLQAQLDTKHIDRMMNPESFFSVSKNEFDKLSEIKSIKLYAVFTQSASGLIKYSEKYSEAYQNWMKNEALTSKVTPHSDIFGVAKERLSYLNTAYIECGVECLALSCTWIIKDI